MSFTAADISRMAFRLKESAELWTYLPPPCVAFSGEGGVYCICGAGVPYGAIHGHGVRAFVVPDPKRRYGATA